MQRLFLLMACLLIIVMSSIAKGSAISKITFHRNRDGIFEILVMKSAEPVQTRLINFPAYDRWAWSTFPNAASAQAPPPPTQVSPLNGNGISLFMSSRLHGMTSPPIPTRRRTGSRFRGIRASPISFWTKTQVNLQDGLYSTFPRIPLITGTST